LGGVERGEQRGMKIRPLSHTNQPNKPIVEQNCVFGHFRREKRTGTSTEPGPLRLLVRRKAHPHPVLPALESVGNPIGDGGGGGGEGHGP
jgi:hypothetical protein